MDHLLSTHLLSRKNHAMTDCEVINAFVDFIKETRYPGLQVNARPDQGNRSSSDIDAIAGDLAIEHTSIDTLPNQRQHSDWFMKAAGGLDQELSVKPPFRLRITLEYYAVKKGQKWTAIRSTLKHWIASEAHHLKDGSHVLHDIPGIPFRLYVTKTTDRRPRVIFARIASNDTTLPIRIREQFIRKAEKLGKYGNMKKILLVESDDSALMNEVELLNALRQAFPNGLPLGIDQVWYADTSVPTDIEFYDLTAGYVTESPNKALQSISQTECSG
jgi:hypothetical protein